MGEELQRHGVERPPGSLWDRIRAQPERAPEHIALAAAERFAEPARRFAERPALEPAELALEARRSHVRLARAEGAALGLGGALTAVPDLLALAWLQSRMVFFIAAAYGYDPGHPMRPAELLALQDVYDTPADARKALDGMGTPIALQMLDRQLKKGGEGELRRRLLRYAGRRIAKRYTYKAVPLIASPLSAIENARATSALGDRALAYYGG